MGRWRVSLVLLAACGARSPAPAPEPDPFADDPVAAFGGLETDLARARRVEITATAQSSGVFSSEITGTLDVEREHVVAIEIDGTFGDAPIAAAWRSDEPVDDAHSDVGSPVWADAVLIGVTRMGALHNFARLVAGADPDHGNGDVRTWVQVDQIAWKSGEPDTRTLTFAITVAGVPAGEAALILDGRGLPLRREQTVHFPEGDMIVVEHYDRFVVTPP